MIQLRFGVFETNSSSTHTLQICTADEYKKLQQGELVLSEWTCGLYTLEEAVKTCVKNHNDYHNGHLTAEEILKKDHEEILEFIHDEYDFYTLDEFYDNDYLESFSEHYTTPSGDEIVVFGRYGYDG